MAIPNELVRSDNIYTGDVLGRDNQISLFMLQISDKLSSTHKGFETYAPVLKWNFAMEWFQQGNVTGQTIPRRPTTGTPLEVILHYGDYIPKLLTSLSKQEVIGGDNTILKLIANEGATESQLIMMMTLSNATLQTVDLTSDLYPYFRIILRYTKVAVEYHKIDQTDLTDKGQTAFSYDFNTATAG
jgi:hypothetical protein